jgi:ligand-binding sensor domain-containing protein
MKLCYVFYCLFSVILAAICGSTIAYSASPVKDMAIDKEGRVYAATWGGITVYDKDGNTLFRYTEADGLPTDSLTSACVAPDNAVWFGSTHGVIRLWNGEISTFTVRNGLNDNLVYCVAYSPTLGLLAGTERGVCRLVGNRFEPLDDEHEFARRRVYDIHIDQRGTAWFAKEAGLSRYANKQDRTVFRRDTLQFPVESGPVRNEIFCVATDQQNRPWVGTRTGISFFDGRKWRSFVETPQGPMGFPELLNPYVTSLCFSADGQLWIGHGNAEKNSITVMKDGSWRHLSIGDGAEAGSIYKIRSYGDRIWLATANGIYYYSGDKFVSFSVGSAQRPRVK